MNKLFHKFKVDLAANKNIVSVSLQPDNHNFEGLPIDTPAILEPVIDFSTLLQQINT